MKSHIQRVRILYKTILKLHKGLPQELHILGTNYVRDEFKRHKSASASEADVFMNEWTAYALTLADQLGVKGQHSSLHQIGASLSEVDINRLRDEQIYQLYDLMLEATKKK